MPSLRPTLSETQPKPVPVSTRLGAYGASARHVRSTRAVSPDPSLPLRSAGSYVDSRLTELANNLFLTSAAVPRSCGAFSAECTTWRAVQSAVGGSGTHHSGESHRGEEVAVRARARVRALMLRVHDLWELGVQHRVDGADGRVRVSIGEHGGALVISHSIPKSPGWRYAPHGHVGGSLRHTHRRKDGRGVA